MFTKQNGSKSLVVANLIALIVTIVINYIPWNGVTVGDVSDALPSFFTPAGYTFAIWGLIYLSLLAYVVYQVLPSQRNNPAIKKIGWLFLANSVVNSAWIIAWLYGSYVLSVILMVAILVTLAAIYARLGNGFNHNQRSWQQRLFFHFPFSVYMGWISVATIANIASVAQFYGWDGFGIDPQNWSAIMMLVAVVVVAVLLNKRRDFAYAGVLVWALFGIRTAFIDIPVIANTAVVAAALIVAIAIIGTIRSGSAKQVMGTLESQPA